MKRNDLILIGIILMIALLFGGIQYFKPADESARVMITINGELYGSYPLSDKQTIAINNTNQLIIEDGMARMTDADCPDQLCVNQHAISKDGESIICLPNKVVVTIVGGVESEIDAVTN